jgi:exosome complex component RRP4
MAKLFVKPKDIVVPGEELAEGMDYLPGQGAYREKDKIIASRLGLVQVDGRAIKIIPLTGKYQPEKGDVIVAKVIDIAIAGWRLDTNSTYSAMVGMKDASTEYIERGADLTRWFTIGDWVVAKVINVTSQKLIDLTLKGPGLKKLGEGRIINVNPNKVPRIIGRGGSMVSLITASTKCQIVIGQNGVVWLSGAPNMELIATEAIRFVEENAHTTGLTDRVSALLSTKVK